MFDRMIKQQLSWKPYVQELCKQPDVHTSEEYWKVGNIEDLARSQSNTEADLLADFCTLVHMQKCQLYLSL